MSWMARFRRTLAGRRMESELDEELQTHVEMRSQDNLAAGMPEDEARREARRRFGNAALVKEDARAARTLPWLDSVAADVRYALRTLRKAPLFTAAAVLTLALGLGANTALFSVLHAVMIRPLPYPEPDRLLALYEIRRGERGTLSPADLVDYREAPALQEIAAFAVQGMNLTQAGTPEALTGHMVSAEFFSTLGVHPALGRDFAAGEDSPGGSRVVILSHELWKSRWNGDPALVGKTITLDMQPYEVIGILPAGFKAPLEFQLTQPVAFYTPPNLPAEMLTRRTEKVVRAVARLRPGATVQQAQQQLDAIRQALEEAHSEAKGGGRPVLAPLRADIAGNFRTPLLLLLGAVAAILLIACVNVANLLLVRATVMERETAVRLAMGASRWRLARGLVTQSCVLALLGCAAGFALASWMKDGLIALAPATVPRLGAAQLDWRVLGFSALLALAVGIGFGLLPAASAFRVPISRALQTGIRAAADPRTMRWRNLLMISEVALCLVLLVGSALLIRSLAEVNSNELGYETERVLVAGVNLPQAHYSRADQRYAFFEELAQRVQQFPGVRSAAFASRFPTRGGWSGGVQVEIERGDMVDTAIELQAVSASYFRTLGMPILAGRGFSAQDHKHAPAVLLVNRAFADRYFPGGNALGKRLRRHPEAPWISIVGVVGDVRRDGKEAEPAPGAYLHAAQTELYPVRLAELAVATDGEPQQLSRSIQEAVWAMDQDQPVTAVRTLAESVDARLAGRRFLTILLTVFAGLSLALAVIGVYGVVAYSVTQRTAEIGIRMALGARQRQIAWSVLRHGLVFVLVGILAGLALAAGLSRYLRAMVFGISPLDPLSFAAVAVLFLFIAALACALPALHAARVDPMVALREQ